MRMQHETHIIRQTTPRSANALKSANALWRRVRRISVLSTLLYAVLGAATAAKAAPPAKEPWEIQIIPATKMMFPPAMGTALPGAPQNPNEMPEGAQGREQTPPRGGDRPRVAAIPPGMIYYQIYRSIPFSNAEYHANPSYRNEATLSLIFNQMPYYSIVKEQGNQMTPLYGYPTPSFYSTRNPQ
jgi:hypothetical protein